MIGTGRCLTGTSRTVRASDRAVTERVRTDFTRGTSGLTGRILLITGRARGALRLSILRLRATGLAVQTYRQSRVVCVATGLAIRTD